MQSWGEPRSKTVTWYDPRANTDVRTPDGKVVATAKSTCRVFAR